MSTVKLPGATFYDTHIIIHTWTHAYDVNLARELQKLLSNAEHKHGVFDQLKNKKGQINGSG